MKRFLIKTLLVALPVIILSYPLDVFISKNLATSHGYAGELEVNRDIYNGTAGCDVAVYGSSRAWVHIDPRILEDSLGITAYNFGIDAHNFWVQYLRHLELLKHNPNPRYIIYSIDVFSLKKRKDLYQMEQYLPYMLWNKNIREYTSSYIGFSTLDYFIPLKRYIGQKKALNSSFAFAHNRSTKYRARVKGFDGKDRQWTRDLERALKERKQFYSKLHLESIALFDQFLRECRESGIEVILVYSPEYIEGQHFVANRDEIFEVFRGFADQYQLLFLDYSDHEMSYEKSNFYNASHMNEAAAYEFTRILAHDLRPYIHAGTRK